MKNTRSPSRKNSVPNSNNNNNNDNNNSSDRPLNGPETANHVNSDRPVSGHEGSAVGSSQSNANTGSTPTHANGPASASTPGRSSARRPWRDQPNIGKYRLVRTIGRGNFAKVKLAEHVSTGRQVAVKVIDKTQLNRASLLKLFREVKIMKMLNHPNIVRLYEVIESDRHVYLVMEYAPNGEVFDYLVTNGRMKEKEARAKFRQLVSAVEYCHCKNIVHRDLKAENLLLDKDFNIKLADFGFSNFYDGENKLDTFCGSPPYAAPELFQGQKYYGPEVDCWSLGVILYTLVSGSLPFDAQHLKELQSCVIRGKYRVPFYMSTDCELLLRKLLVINPSKRKPLKAIMTDRWLNLGYEDNILQPYVEPPPNYNDPVRLAIMKKMGYQPEEVREELEKQSFNNVTAIYLLLADPKTQLNLPAHSFVRSGRESKTEQSTPSHKSVAEGAEQSAPNLGVLTTDSTPSGASKNSNAENTATNGSVKADVQNNGEKKPSGISWLKQSSSAGPTSSRTGETAVDNVAPGLPRIQLTDVSNNETTNAAHLDNDKSATDAAWIRRNNTFTVKKMRTSGSDTSPPDQSCPLSRAPQFSNIPNHLVSNADSSTLAEPTALVTNSTTAADEDSVVLPRDASTELLNLESDNLKVTAVPEHSNTAPLPAPVVTTLATPYQRKNPTFSCHRPRTKDSGSPVRTAAAPTAAPNVDQSPVVHVDSNFQLNVIDMLNPETRHQFARNCPERSTVAAPSARRIGFPATKQAGGPQLLPISDTKTVADNADSVSSASTMSRADTLNDSSANTLDSDVTHKRTNTPQTPKKTEEFTLPSEVLAIVGNNSSSSGQDYRNSSRMKLPAAIIPAVTSATTPNSATRDPMTQWSMRLRVAGPTEKSRTNEAPPAVAPSVDRNSSAEPSIIASATAPASTPGPNVSNPSTDIMPTLTSAKPYQSSVNKPGQFFRRITSRLSRNYTHGRADEVKQHDEMDTGLGSDHPAVYAAGPLSDISDTQTGVRLATDSSRNGSTGDLISSHHPHPVDPWTDRQRQRRPKSSATSSKHATIAVTSANHDPESHSSGTDARNGYQGESADDNTLTARENEPFIPRLQENRSGRFSSVLTGSLGRRRVPGTDSDLVGGGVTAVSSPRKPSKPRRLHFVYRLRVIGRDPETLLNEIVRVLNQNGISYVHRNEFCLSCTTANQPNPQLPRQSGLPDSTNATVTGGTSTALSAAVGGGEEDEDRLINSDPQNVAHLKWEMEVCRLGKPKSRYGVKFKRVSGDPEAFKQLEQALTHQFNLPST
ncbi:Serine/threonine-protein kinase MARK2 [Fasciolopsis buskii]|uniref:non-specific serine/threonine protein kinase n=1 Tax=Fasciolopsis buskii TaxID=27845 RepID=A0A8E0RN20_9TREM|nr:Serine/threonine-protein kinase MARK2 [Fasciolopsis buski]